MRAVTCSEVMIGTSVDGGFAMIGKPSFPGRTISESSDLKFKRAHRGMWADFEDRARDTQVGGSLTRLIGRADRVKSADAFCEQASIRLRLFALGNLIRACRAETCPV